jgi:DNA polymerase-3 subunit alpha
VFNELLEAERAKIREDEVLIIEGRVQRDDFAGEGRVKVVAERLLTLAEARGRFARHLRLSLNGQASGSNARTAVHRLRTLLAPYTLPAIARCAWRTETGTRPANWLSATPTGFASKTTC